MRRGSEAEERARCEAGTSGWRQAVAALLLAVVVGLGMVLGGCGRSTPTPYPTALPDPRASGARTRQVDGMEMVHVPSGEFLIGSSGEDIDAVLAGCGDCDRGQFEYEQPQRLVHVDGFWIDRTEVTNAQYHRCMDDGDCQAPTCPYHGKASKSDHPVVCVDWSAARAYCEWAGARLPTEAEWEKAARGRGGQVYPWGDAWEEGRSNSYEAEVVDTVPVGSYPEGASPYGVLDMAGNALEWVADWFDAEYYSNSPLQNPQGPDAGERKVLRGGSWNSSDWAVRAASRYYAFDPAFTNVSVGFRCVQP